MELTDDDLTTLRWMARANADGVGLFGPAFAQGSTAPACERLIDCGMATVDRTWRPARQRGLWITPKGRAALFAFTRPAAAP